MALSFTDGKSFEGSILKLDQKNSSSIDVAPYHAVKLDIANPDARMSVMPQGVISFKRLVSEDKKDKLFMSSELKKYTIVKVMNDTLFVTIDWQKMKSYFTKGEMRIVSGVNYTVYSDNVDFINLVPTITTEINGLNAQFIRVSSLGDVKIGSCTADKLESARGNLQLNNSKLKQLNLDLDEIYNWEVKDCEIGEENLSGSKTHYVKTPRSETKALNWYPKNKDARLNIELSADSARLVFK
ncbi:MAG: hypothetical protein BGN96_13670 [Bacteroidales bacterium 45-6]|nr:MAG: hypothetical protein BGN96_13670 [Bacteroidales bacterium 45-6]